MPATTKFSKALIIDTAFDIAVKKGVDALTIRLIAKEVGSSIAPIYVNFKSIDDLKKAVLDKAQAIYQTLVKEEKTEDLFLRFALASIKFSKHYPKLYDAFLLSKDDPMDSELNFKRMQSTIQSMPPYNQIEPKALRTFIITMQALQVGLSIMARKAYYQNDLTDEAVIDILDNTGNILINQLKTKGAL